MPARLAAVLFLGACLVVPEAAGAAVFRATISGRQELSWRVDGTTGSCEIRHGVGQGEVTMTFRSTKSSLLAVNRTDVAGSIDAIAKGSISGSFTDSPQTPCPGFTPDDPYTVPAAGCGALRYGLRVDLSRHGAFVYVVGPEVPLGPVSIAQSGGDCPFPDGGYFFSTNGDRTACGDGKQVWQRSWGVVGPTGLFATKLQVTTKGLLHVKKGKTKHITGRKDVDCTTGSQYSGGIPTTGKLQYTLSLKRLR
jgi:hypothetical protein